MKRPVQKCPKCKKVKKMTSHHIFPKTHFKGKGKRGLLCRECHNDLEYEIQKQEGRNKKGERIKLDPIVYLSIWNSFISV